MPLGRLLYTINWNDVNAAFAIMGKGMLGIFVVIGLLALIVYGLTKVGSSAKKG